MALAQLYRAFPLEVAKARGCYVYAKDGRRFLDTCASVGVHVLGHSDKGLLDAMHAKLQRYTHISNALLDDDARPVAKRLLELTRAEGRVCFANSGSEATEVALKCLKRQATPQRAVLVSFEQGVHGRTLGALSLNGISAHRTPFEPLLPNVVQLPFNDVAVWREFCATRGSEILAVFCEAVQGSGGIVPMTKEFATALTAAQAKHGFSLVCDETQCGLFRTGRAFGYQHLGLNPDIVTVAKALGGGLPLGACIMLGRHAEVLQPGDHGSTFAPNPVALAAASHLLGRIEEVGEKVSEKAEYLNRSLARFSSKVQEVRGKGLMVGVVLPERRPRLRDEAFFAGLLLNVLNEQIIRIMPPLNISYAEIDEMMDKLALVLLT